MAGLLNRHFVSVKVDREERPDVDAVYMAACQALTGSGGWPLTVFMGPDRKPFFVGTYFPKHAKYGHPGLLDLLRSISRQWQSNRAQLIETGAALYRHLQSVQTQEDAQDAGEDPSRESLTLGFTMLRRMFDSRNGGFGSAPKFPMPHQILFLMRYAQQERESAARDMAHHTLRQMGARRHIRPILVAGFPDIPPTKVG